MCARVYAVVYACARIRMFLGALYFAAGRACFICWYSGEIGCRSLRELVARSMVANILGAVFLQYSYNYGPSLTYIRSFLNGTSFHRENRSSTNVDDFLRRFLLKSIFDDPVKFLLKLS